MSHLLDLRHYISCFFFCFALFFSIRLGLHFSGCLLGKGKTWRLPNRFLHYCQMFHNVIGTTNRRRLRAFGVIFHHPCDAKRFVLELLVVIKVVLLVSVQGINIALRISNRSDDVRAIRLAPCVESPECVRILYICPLLMVHTCRFVCTARMFDVTLPIL